MNTKNKPMTSLKSDAEAEKFVSTADLSKFDLSGFKPMRFELEPKSAALHLRLPEALLEGLKGRAKARGIPYTRYVRMLLENDLAKSSG
jgi:predicted DNA binding CopG/RHH family protein